MFCEQDEMTLPSFPMQSEMLKSTLISRSINVAQYCKLFAQLEKEILNPYESL